MMGSIERRGKAPKLPAESQLTRWFWQGLHLHANPRRADTLHSLHPTADGIRLLRWLVEGAGGLRLDSPVEIVSIRYEDGCLFGAAPVS